MQPLVFFRRYQLFFPPPCISHALKDTIYTASEARLTQENNNDKEFYIVTTIAPLQFECVICAVLTPI